MTNGLDDVLLELPETPVGRAAAWMFRQLATGAEGLEDEEFERYLGPLTGDRRRPDLAAFRQHLSVDLERLGGALRFDRVISSSDHEFAARFIGAEGRGMEYTVRVAAEPPHYLLDAFVQKELPPGVAVRLARPEDGPALREVAARAPLRLGDVSVTIDPGEDYFAACRLMGDSSFTYVATHEDVPIGIHCGVSYPARVEGRTGLFFLIAHSRLLPEYSGGGVWSRLNSMMFGHFFGSGQEYISGVAYVRPENSAAQRLGGAESRWSVRPFRAVLGCERLAGAEVGRPAGPQDADRIVEILNACHGEEELFVPYTADTFTERLSRAPDLYTWHDVLIGERALAGVWRAGEIRTSQSDGGDAVVSRRAAVLDYGFEPGAEDELVGLLSAWCARLAGEGFTHLGVFTSPASPGSALLRGLAVDVEEYDLMPPGLVEPPTTATNGIYVDPVYF